MSDLKRITPEEVLAAYERVAKKFGYKPIRGRWVQKESDGKICGVCAAVALYTCDPNADHCVDGPHKYIARRCSGPYMAGFCNAWDGYSQPVFTKESEATRQHILGYRDGAASAALVFADSES